MHERLVVRHGQDEASIAAMERRNFESRKRYKKHMSKKDPMNLGAL
jgi:hypothetical protein